MISACYVAGATLMNAGRFQIAVHDAGFVRRLEAARARRADRQIGNVPVEVVQRATQTRLPDDLLRLSPEAMPVFRGRIMARLLRSPLPCVPIVQRPRTWPFQGQDMGSNPVGDAT